MTHAISLKEGVIESQALLHYAAHRLATRSAGRATAYDTVSVNDSVAVIEGRISAAANASESSLAGEQREKPQG